MKKKRIAFFGNFGQGNIGNESTLQAIIWNLRRYLPDVEVQCVCTGFEAAKTLHNISVVAMNEIFFEKPNTSGKFFKLLWHTFIGVPLEFYRWFKTWRYLKGVDMLIVPGTQILSDNLCGPFSWPYWTFRWAILSKLARCNLLFVSVGVGPLRHPLSKLFIKSALKLADYRSYRDEISKEYLNNIGFNSRSDPVYPDLAFSFPISNLNHEEKTADYKKPIVAIGVKDYEGQYGLLKAEDSADSIYRRYLMKLADFVTWLLKQDYRVRLVIGDSAYDPQVQADLKQVLSERNTSDKDGLLIDQPIESLDQLISMLAQSDIVASSRFHNVVFGMLLNKPVIALAYHDKFAALLEGPQLAEYHIHIDNMDIANLTSKIGKIINTNDEIIKNIGGKVREYRSRLDEQYDAIFKA
jgi:polysaccharide pyruvyl transferase WcaK-like protein